ncbi:DUF6602 domain-containing protein [Stenotrophomonas maltophilia]|uniref:DUF6602 domain-containing protein n=1 Tax=Stenotrophomonas maltophilia TaxID=40324 RepID=UPI0013B4284C|nr:DUF6602 domain-containing protein [Stenotrophomonas maltophilia]MCF3486666.1 hypothetical protein [Stenotrophomonas maltophilia]HDS1666607.1 hypothetical protein [Stenotrophomonas maltophilia]
MSKVTDHFINLRLTLEKMYDDSKSASHTVVMGSLREAFIRSVLEGHLPSTASWSTGQLVGHAPNNDLSGQLDLILHSGELPQIHFHDGFIRLVPSDASIAIVEIKSILTTSKPTNNKPTDVVTGAIASLVKAKKIPRNVGPAANSPVPFHVVAFTTGVSAKTIVKAFQSGLAKKSQLNANYWPESIVVFKGAKKTEPQGFGIFKKGQAVSLPGTATPLPSPAPGINIEKVDGWEALAALVSLLANESASFPTSTFKLETFIY